MTVSTLALALIALMPAARDDKPDQEAFLGTWTIESFERGGRKEPDEAIRDQRMVFAKDNTYAVKFRGQVVEEGTYKLDPSKATRTLDLAITKGTDKGKAQPAIYKLEGDTLRICLALPGEKDRPSEFSSTGDPEKLLVVLKRQKP